MVLFNGNELPDDLDLARNLYSTIVDLQSNPILTDKQISDAQRKLDKLDEHIQTSKNASLKKELQAINKDEIAYLLLNVIQSNKRNGKNFSKSKMTTKSLLQNQMPKKETLLLLMI